MSGGAVVTGEFCPGHEPGPSEPAGLAVYCDGSCVRRTKARPALPATRDERVALAARLIAGALSSEELLVQADEVDEAGGWPFAVDVANFNRALVVRDAVSTAIFSAGFPALTSHSPMPLPDAPRCRLWLSVHLGPISPEVPAPAPAPAPARRIDVHALCAADADLVTSERLRIALSDVAGVIALAREASRGNDERAVFALIGAAVSLAAAQPNAADLFEIAVNAASTAREIHLAKASGLQSSKRSEPS